MSFEWPTSFSRIPDDDWVQRPVEALALNYDTVEAHGWYANLDHTVYQLGEALESGSILIDYSGGTGILAQRLLREFPDLDFGVLVVDSSPKFLRLALEKFRNEPRLAFRHIRYLREERRLERVDEVVGSAVLERRVEALASTNAIHLYFDLADTVRAWREVLKPNGQVFIQSGNIRHPEMGETDWLIDETVHVIHETAREIVLEDSSYEAYRDVLTDTDYVEAHDTLRKKYFLPVRSLEYYLEVLEQEGFRVTSVERMTIPARVDQWYDFLSVYHEGVLGWVGGAEKVTGSPAAQRVIEDRLSLMRAALQRMFAGQSAFGASWTYITCEPAPPASG